MSMSLADFKKAFTQYTGREEKDQRKEVAEGLKGQRDHLQQEFDKIKEEIVNVRERVKNQVDDKVNELASEAGRADDEDFKKETRVELRKKLKAELEEVDNGFKELVKTKNFTQEAALEARERLQELEAMVTDQLSDGKTSRLKELLEGRLEANEKLDALKSQSPSEEPGKLSPGRGDEHAEGTEWFEGGVQTEENLRQDRSQRSVNEMLQGRGEAQQWQEEEIKAVKESHEKLKSLDDELKYSAAVEKWQKQLHAETGKLRKAVDEAVDAVVKARKDVNGARKDLDVVKKDFAKSEEWLKNNADVDSNDRVRKRHEKTVEGYAGDLNAATKALESKELALQTAKNEVVLRSQAVNDHLDTELEKLKQLAAQVGQAAKLKNDQLVIGTLDVDLKDFRVTPPDVSVEKPLKLGAPPKVDSINVNPDKIFPELERTANKHGTGRHGVQTGIEQQARRLATGGTTPDQMGNEWGTSRPLVNESGESLAKVQWKSVAIEWKDVGEGKREISKKTVEEVEQQVYRELRSQGASASSMFLNPELEKEAADRATQICQTKVTDKWALVRDKEDDPWKSLDRVVITLGPPKRAVGYGHGMRRKEDIEKMTLTEVNKLLEDFRQGKLDQNQILERMNVALTPVSDTDSGAKIMPHCKVIMDRVGAKWINTSQFPCDDPVGWSLKDKHVKGRDDVTHEVAGELVE